MLLNFLAAGMCGVVVLGTARFCDTEKDRPSAASVLAEMSPRRSEKLSASSRAVASSA